jgi:hypothetical protein
VSRRTMRGEKRVKGVRDWKAKKKIQSRPTMQ